MLTKAYSPEAALLVLVYTGTYTSDAEYEEMIGAWERFHREAKRRTAGGIVIVPREHPQPNAHWRRRLADVHRNADGPRHICLVTTSAAIRGVITAVSWLVSFRGNVHSHAFDTFDAAVARLETLMGGSGPVLRALFAEAQEKIRCQASADRRPPQHGHTVSR